MKKKDVPMAAKNWQKISDIQDEMKKRGLELVDGKWVKKNVR